MAAPAQQLAGLRLGLVLFATCGAGYAIFIVMGCVAVGVPTIATDLRASQADAQWIGDVYPLSLACLLLPSGVVADRFGRRKALLVGLSITTGSLVVVSQTDSTGTLILALAATGVGSGIAFPSTLSTITAVTPPRRRDLAVGLWATTVPLGGTLGVIWGGIAIELLSWQAMFFGAACTAALALLVTVLSVPETRDTAPAPLDAVGAALSIITVAGIVLGITDAPVHGWTDPSTLLRIGTGLLAGVAFVAWELRTPHPMIDIRLFRLPSFGSATVAIFVAFLGMYGLLFVLFQYEAYALGFGVLACAMGVAPIVSTMGGFAFLGPVLAARFGPKPIIAIALLSGVIGALMIGAASTQQEIALLLPGIVVFGTSLGLGAGPVTEAIATELPPAKQGVASAVNTLARELGATMGIAISGTAFNFGYRYEVGSALDTTNDPVAKVLEESPAAGIVAAAQAGPAQDRYIGVMEDAAARGFLVAAVVLALISAIALVFFVLRFPGRARLHALDGISGLVADGAGTPVPAARVCLIDHGGNFIGRGITDASGRFHIDSPPTGDYFVVCAADDRLPRMDPLTVNGAGVHLELDLEWEPGAAEACPPVVSQGSGVHPIRR